MTGRLFIGLFLILIGLSALTGLSLFEYLFAFFFIYMGIRILSGRNSWTDVQDKKTLSEDYLNDVLVFSAVNKTIKSDQFTGGKITMIFSGGEIDLSGVKTEGEIEMECTAVFGGLKVIIPKTWKVSSEGVGILGGYDNKTESSKGDTVLKMKGAAIFGGIELVNKE
jgi:hypothetical protein